MQVKNQQNKTWTNNLKEILDLSKQSIEENKSEDPTGTPTTTFHRPAEEENTYVHFGYGPQENFLTYPRISFRINEQWYD